MKPHANKKGHFIGIYLKEKKKTHQAPKPEDCTLASLYHQLISSSTEAKEGTKLFQQLLFKQLNSFPDQSWILKLLKHQLPCENESRSSQEIKWFTTRPLLLEICLPTGDATYEPGAIHFYSVMGSFHGLHSEQPTATEGACAWPLLLIGKR